MSTAAFASQDSDDGQLPFIDKHAISIDAPLEVVWRALQRYFVSSLCLAEGNPLARLLGTQPPAGFQVSRSTPPEHLTLVGRHRFARYMLAFDLAPVIGGATNLRATSYAVFPGIHGRAYRAFVVGTRAHAIATRHILRSIRRRSIEMTAYEGLTP